MTKTDKHFIKLPEFETSNNFLTFEDGDFALWTGPDKGGKTTFITNFVADIACNQDKKVMLIKTRCDFHAVHNIEEHLYSIIANNSCTSPAQDKEIKEKFNLKYFLNKFTKIRDICAHIEESVFLHNIRVFFIDDINFGTFSEEMFVNIFSVFLNFKSLCEKLNIQIHLVTEYDADLECDDLDERDYNAEDFMYDAQINLDEIYQSQHELLKMFDYIFTINRGASTVTNRTNGQIFVSELKSKDFDQKDIVFRNSYLFNRKTRSIFGMPLMELKND